MVVMKREVVAWWIMIVGGSVGDWNVTLGGIIAGTIMPGWRENRCKSTSSGRVGWWIGGRVDNLFG